MICDNIKKFRLNNKLTQKELADKSHITRESIGNYERGDRIPNVEILSKIAAALNVNTDMLTCADAFQSEVFNRAVNIAINYSKDNDIFLLLGNYADYDNLFEFYNHTNHTLSNDDIKGLLSFIADYSINDYKSLYTNLIETNVYNLNNDIKDFCISLYFNKSNLVDYVSDEDKEIVELFMNATTYKNNNNQTLHVVEQRNLYLPIDIPKEYNQPHPKDIDISMLENFDTEISINAAINLLSSEANKQNFTVGESKKMIETLQILAKHLIEVAKEERGIKSNDPGDKNK